MIRVINKWVQLRFSAIAIGGFFYLTLISSCGHKENTAVIQGEENFTVIIGGNKVGYLKAISSGDSIFIDYDYKNNGRGPTIKELIKFDESGRVNNWKIYGNTVFGNAIDESYSFDGKVAKWQDAAGKDSVNTSYAMPYLNQSGSPYSSYLYAGLLLSEPENSMEVLPGGKLQLKELESFSMKTEDKEIALKSYALSGANLNPVYFVLDSANRFFAGIISRGVTVREGFESLEKELRELAIKYSANRFNDMQKKFSHVYGGDTRIRNVHIFNPKTLELSELSSVVVRGERILSIESADAPGSDYETEIDGNGGTLIPGLYEMHGHMGEERAMLNVLAGVTSVRDMGNNNEVLEGLINKIASGEVVGPRITRLGFIEGKSPFNSNNGILVESQEEAIAAVEKYHEMGFYGIKLYNSMKGEWAPAIIRRARELNMFVTGHVPAFSNANAMIRAGYNEMTHINQVMLGWVLNPDEDTRTLLRLTALKRLPDLDLNSEKVQETINLMVENKVAIDPTLSIHESLLLSRNGKTRQGSKDYIENMPSEYQRENKAAMADIASEEDDIAYRGAYDKIIETLRLMKSRGILIIPGTDLGGEFHLHRELELYQQLGYTPAELLKLGSYDMANYLGHTDRGIIEPEMLADFFLVPNDPTKDIKAIKTISMVSKGGVFYYPTEVYPEFGIKPFTTIPAVSIGLQDN